ncbi:MAG: FG-GAP repeat protein [Actinomycetota bacterium]
MRRIALLSFLVATLVGAAGLPAMAGSASAAAGGGRAGADFNGDGFDDLAVGVHGETIGTEANAGAVNVLYGARSGLSAAGDQFWHQDSPGVDDVAEAGDEFGAALAAGDFNGDGFDDLAVGVRFEDIAAATDAGAVNILYGSAAGLTATGDRFLHQDTAGLSDVAEAGDLFGAALAAANFGKGRQADLAVGAHGEDVGAATDAGAVNVIYGSPGGLASAGDQFWNQDTTGVRDVAESDDLFGVTLAAANFGKGRRADLAVGALREDVDTVVNAGAVNVLYGSSRGLNVRRDQFWNQDTTGVEDVAEASDNFGSALTAANFGKRRRADLAIAVVGEDVGAVTNAGAVNVLYGSSRGLNVRRDQFWNQDTTGVEDVAEASDLFGVSLAAANLGRGRQADLVVGVPHEGVGAVGGAGAVNVLYGSQRGLSAARDRFLHQDTPGVEDVAEAGDNWGFGLTGLNFGKGRQADLAVGAAQEDLGAALDAGAVNVLYGSARGVTVAGDQFWHQDSPGVEDVAETNDEFALALAAPNYGNRPLEPL